MCANGLRPSEQIGSPSLHRSIALPANEPAADTGFPNFVAGFPNTATAATLPASAAGERRRRPDVADLVAQRWHAGQHVDHRCALRVTTEHDPGVRALLRPSRRCGRSRRRPRGGAQEVVARGIVDAVRATRLRPPSLGLPARPRAPGPRGRRRRARWSRGRTRPRRRGTGWADAHGAGVMTAAPAVASTAANTPAITAANRIKDHKAARNVRRFAKPIPPRSPQPGLSGQRSHNRCERTGSGRPEQIGSPSLHRSIALPANRWLADVDRVAELRRGIAERRDSRRLGADIGRQRVRRGCRSCCRVAVCPSACPPPPRPVNSRRARCERSDRIRTKFTT